jgi:hypothetical protein
VNNRGVSVVNPQYEEIEIMTHPSPLTSDAKLEMKECSAYGVVYK